MDRRTVSRRSFIAAAAAALPGVLARVRPAWDDGGALRARLAIAVEPVGPFVDDIVCRDAWGARKPRGEFVRHRVRRLTVHHSALMLRDNRDAPQQLRDIQTLHQRIRGWPDIAYHVVIDRHGNVYRGRPSWARGDTATGYDPTGHFLVMCEGNFSEQRIPEMQVAALVDVLAWAAHRFDVSPGTIRGHRDYAATACPGTTLYALIENGSIRRWVRRRMAAGGVRLLSLCGSAGLQRVRDIESGRD